MDEDRPAEVAAGHGLPRGHHVRQEVLHVADDERDSRTGAGLDHRVDVREGGGHRLLDEHVEPARGCVDDHRAMQGVRGV